MTIFYPSPFVSSSIEIHDTACFNQSRWLSSTFKEKYITNLLAWSNLHTISWEYATIWYNIMHMSLNFTNELVWSKTISSKSCFSKSCVLNKVCGLDNIRNKYLKHAPQYLIVFICDFFNLALEIVIIPEVWCQSLIMPLYKNKADRYDTNNYRGITLLSCLGAKLFHPVSIPWSQNLYLKMIKLGMNRLDSDHIS